VLKQLSLVSVIASAAIAQDVSSFPDASVPVADTAALPEAARSTELSTPPDASTPAPGVAPLEGDALFEEMLSMESQLKELVVSTTRTAIRASQSPAVITVVTAEEIQTRGLVDLAGILRTVPGFYDVSDLTTHNVGVRGINGGLRASGNVIKVMIDGVAVDFRPTTGNFFGPELIPVEAIARVEIIRGPASALYGANAFLGVVNVITKTGDALVSTLSPRGGLIRGNLSAQGTAMAAAHHENVEVMFAAHLAYLDRSGLGLPATSPSLTREVWPPSPVPLSERGVSQNDLNRSSSYFGKLTLQDKAAGKLSFLGSWQNLDSVGEFLDLGTLFHGTRVQLENRNYRLMYELPKHEKFSLSVSVQHFTGGPGRDAVHDLGLGLAALVPVVGVSGWGASTEAQWQLHEKVRLVVGLDGVREDHTILAYDRKQLVDELDANGALLRSAGTRFPGPESGLHKLFFNAGGLAQGIVNFNDTWSATLGGRVDFHNIYGVNPSGRAAIVFSPPEKPYSAKLLYGSSYKAPAASQLYAQPMGLGDIRGNPNLKPQYAHTIELAGGYQLPDGWGDITVNAFGTAVLGRVEFIRLGNFASAQNQSYETLLGGEVDARLKPHRRIQVRLAVGYTESVAKGKPVIITGAPELTHPLFAPIQAHLFATWLIPFGGLQLSIELSLIGQRSASQSNALAAGKDYKYEPYVFGGLVLALPPTRLWGDRETSASLRAENLLGQAWSDPGFNGVDVPSLGRTVFLNLSQTF
jgi:iron complex outermembrane receptor protein